MDTDNHDAETTRTLNNESIAKPKSNFTPPRNRDPVLDSYIDHLSKQSLSGNNSQSNLSRNERQALRDLTDDPSIIIKEADKGGAFVIMDTTFYKTKMDKMLSNESTYKKLPQSKEGDAKKVIEKFVKKYSRSLTEEEQKYIAAFDMNISNIYGLPKIHKSKIIIDAINTQKSEYVILEEAPDLKFRPIIAGPTCPTSQLSAFIDTILKPILAPWSGVFSDHQFCAA